MDKIYIGIDPGKNGGISVVAFDKVDVMVMPAIGSNYDVKKMSEFLKEMSLYECHCVIEDVHAIYGSSATATFEFGYGVGLLEGVLVAYKIPYTKVQPKKWQKLMWEGVKLQVKSSSSGLTSVTDTKKMSLVAVQRIFPNTDLKASNRCKVPHDGIVDSLLIAEYGRRMGL